MRNVPLIVIGAYYKSHEDKGWREVFPSFGIAKNTFNELSPVWTTWDTFKATRYLAWHDLDLPPINLWSLPK